MENKIIDNMHQQSKLRGYLYVAENYVKETWLFSIFRALSFEQIEDTYNIYCVGCSRFLTLGGAHTHYLIDLLFHETTTIPPKALN